MRKSGRVSRAAVMAVMALALMLSASAAMADRGKLPADDSGWSRFVGWGRMSMARLVITAKRAKLSAAEALGGPSRLPADDPHPDALPLPVGEWTGGN